MAANQTYQSYKEVDYDYVDKIPEDWELLPNYAIFEERIERGYEDEELLSVTIGRGVIRQAELDKKDSSTADKSKYLLVRKGDMVYSMRFRQGASGYSNYTGIVSPACTVLKPKRGVQINQRYFHYMFRTGFYKNYVERYAYGIADGQMPLRFFDFKRMYSIVPPVETQNDIVAYLDKKAVQVKAFVQKKTALIKLIEEEKNQVVNNAVTKGVNPEASMQTSRYEWIGEYPAHWKVLRLRFLGKCQNGISVSGDKFGQGSPFVSYGDVYKHRSLPVVPEGLVASNLKDQDNYSVREGDVFFTRTSETIEEIGFASTCLTTIKNAVFAGFLIRFRPRKGLLAPRYSQFFFRATIHRAYFVKEVDLVTRASLGQDLLKSLPVTVPPIEEQERIAAYIEAELEQRDRVIKTAEIEIARAREFMDSLITNMVTGRLRVPTPTNHLEGVNLAAEGAETYGRKTNNTF